MADQRADAVIVNGGLGPTVDDLSQEIAANAAGVELKLNEQWLATMEDYFKRRSRVMPPNNIKQAMLPATAEVLDNPVGTACGFAVTIGKARFMFTPGVPRNCARRLPSQLDWHTADGCGRASMRIQPSPKCLTFSHHSYYGMTSLLPEVHYVKGRQAGDKHKRR